MAEQCGKRIGYTRTLGPWLCKAPPMRDRAELVGFIPGRCFQHQPQQVKAAVRRTAQERRRR